MQETQTVVKGDLGYLTREALAMGRPHAPIQLDMRTRAGGLGTTERVACEIRDARQAAGLGLETSGFELFQRPSAVGDWFDADAVMSTYYEECKTLARELTGASYTFTYDHLIREPGRQTAGGGLGHSGETTGPEGGGGYIGSVHMDYTEDTTWTEYLSVHGVREPEGPERVVVLNFWRPICDVVEDNPLAVCDARSVSADELLETVIFGYGPRGYSWHDIGIPTYSVAASPRHRWYYYPRMTRDEVLVIKSYDSEGVIGKTVPHASFQDPTAPPAPPPRRSIELRVLCFIGAACDAP